MRKIDLDRWRVYFELRNEGHAVERSARGAKIDPKTAWRFERGEPGSTGLEAAQILGVATVGGLSVAPEIGREARRALEDFAYFRRRYFGRSSVPWQVRAAEKVRELLETDDREYAVLNMPPGSGKSTLFTHDLPSWLIARDRTVRCLLGHRAERFARMYVGRLKKTLERSVPMAPDTEMLGKGLAFYAEATLAGDFGAFKPEGRSDLWRADALVVQQYGGMAADDKEPTVSAFGADSAQLGGRFDFIVWDDLVDKKNLSGDALDNLIEAWVTEFETRLEPSGLMLLQGQRMGPSELYRFCLDMRDMDDRPKYHHVVFPAHDESRCERAHTPDQRPQAWPGGCLLDPHRLPWKFLSNIAAITPRIYDIQYQQNDGQAVGQLVRSAWLDGGRDRDGVEHPGCYDAERPFGHSTVAPHTGWSVLSVDPSPSKFWGVTWWVMDPPAHRYEIVEVHRQRMGSEEFLSQDMTTRAYSGLIEEIRTRANAIGHPLQALILEVNAAQKYLLAQPHMQEWARTFGITLMPHTTHINKADPVYGVTGIADFFRQGAIRIPKGDMDARVAIRPLILELTTWPDGATDDLVMSVWFAIRAVQMTYADPNMVSPRFDRPDWISSGRGLGSIYKRGLVDA